MSTDSSNQSKSADTPAGESAEAKDKSFIVMLDDDADSGSQEHEQKATAQVAGDDEKVSADQSASADESPKGSFVVLLDDDDDEPEDELGSIVSLNEQGECTVTFPEDISIRNIMALKTALTRTLEASSVTFDASRADIVDTSTIQLLYAHGVWLSDHKIPSTWENRSARFSAVEKRLGFNLSQ